MTYKSCFIHFKSFLESYVFGSLSELALYIIKRIVLYSTEAWCPGDGGGALPYEKVVDVRKKI